MLESEFFLSNVYDEVERPKHNPHLDLLDCEATSKIQSSPLNNLLTSSNGVARNVGLAFESIRLCPSRLVLTPSLDAVKPVGVRLEGNT